MARVAPQEKIEQGRTVNDKIPSLNHPSNYEILTVLCTFKGKDLSDLVTMKDLPHQLRLLVIPPDRIEDDLAKRLNQFLL